MGASTITEIVDFTGGMNTLLASHLIARNEAKSLINVDIRYGALASMPNLNLVQSLDDGPFFFQFDREIYSFENWRSNVEWDNKWYWSDGIDIGKVLEDGTELALGLPTPTTALTQTLSGAGPIEGDLKYTYTFWSSETGAESAPAPLPLYTKADGNNIQLTGFEPLPVGATDYRLYRVGGYLPAFLQVDTFDTNTYIDTLDNTKIDGRALQTMRNGPPPTNLRNLVELNGRFYGSVGNRIYFSALGNPDSWYVADYFIVKGTIIALAGVPAGLLVMGQFSTSLLYGSDANNFRLKLISDQYGCLGPESVAKMGDSVIWLSNKQMVMSNGYKIMDITAFKIDRIVGMIPTGAAVENETYYMSFKPSLFPDEELYPEDWLYPDAIDGTSTVAQGIMALDFKRGNSFSYKMIEYNNVRTIGIVDANLAVSTGAYDAIEVPCNRAMYPNCNDFTACSNFALNTMMLYQGQGLAELDYISPRFIDSGFSVLKQYDKVRIMAKGAFNVKVYLEEDNLVVEDNLVILDDSDEEMYTIGIPNNNNLGHYIRFEVVGIGIISSIQYSWKNREVVN